MNVIWKRPDGFHSARPADFVVVQLQTNSSRIWLHRSDTENYPLRISGGWQDEEATVRLNRLINLLGKSAKVWQEELSSMFNDSKFEGVDSFISDQDQWLQSLKLNLKGDTWEIQVMTDTIEEIRGIVRSIKKKIS